MEFVSGITLINWLCKGNGTSIKIKPTAVYTPFNDGIRKLVFVSSLFLKNKRWGAHLEKIPA